ncbi:MAG: hypothetical protein HY864_08755 [Chloroflexi bacterium]|nr:hypothetical protein [Chloroflexota bacterium]
MNTPSLPICPKCRQTDQIQKVTSAYGLNTKEWYETRTSTDSDGNSHSYQERHEAHTQLGLRLKPPQKPASPTHPGLWYAVGGLVVFALASVLCPIAFVPLSFILPLLGGSAFIPDIAGMPAWVITLFVVGLPTLCFILLGLGLLVWLGSKVKKRFDSDMKKYRDKKAVFERDELPRWQRAKERWEQMYFCMRDETVFIPAENKAIKADDMEKYLYDPQFRS